MFAADFSLKNWQEKYGSITLFFKNIILLIWEPYKHLYWK
jgi:hypothetical protein